MIFLDNQSKFKGRVVYRGDCVKDEWGDAAVFKDITNAQRPLRRQRLLTSTLASQVARESKAMLLRPFHKPCSKEPKRG